MDAERSRDARGGRAPRVPIRLFQVDANPFEAMKYNCSKCPGYCCSYSRIAVSDHDIARLARHFDISVPQAREKFTYRYQTKEADEQILRHQKDHIYGSICRFFDTDKRRCTVYEA